MPLYLQAGLWGTVAGATLVLGAATAWFAHVPRLAVATVMGFGSGVLFSALTFDLVDEAERSGGPPARTHLLTGLVVTLGFVTAFTLTRA